MANYIYGLPRKNPTPLPYPLKIGFDWLRFHTPPYAGGLFDQPIQLMREIRTAVNAYNTITAYKNAGGRMSLEAFSNWQAANREIVKYMEFVWELQEVAGSIEE